MSASATAFDGASIDVISLADHRRKTIQRGATYGRYLPSGHLIYINRGTLFAVPFDLDRLDVRGTPVPVLSEVAYTRSAGSAQLAFSQRGTLVYRSGRGLMIVPWLDAMGKTQALLDRPGDYLHIELSPDGNRLALLSAGDVWVYEAPRFTMTRLTVGGGMHANPTWSPDGRFIVFQDSGGISWTRSDGSGAAQPLTRSKNAQYPYSFSPDSKRLAFYETDPQTLFDVWTVPLEYDAAGLHAGKPEPFLHTSADERHGVFSPDGHWLAYTSSATGLFQVFVRAFPDKGGQWVVSVGDGTFPWWSKNGRELFYRTLGGQVMVVNYTVKGGSFVTDKARPWTDKRLGITDTGRNFDLSPDGKRVAALLPAETAEVQRAQNHVILLENFFDEVRRHFPER